MLLAEPMTALTDYAMTVEGIVLGLWLTAGTERSAQLWGGALLALGVAAATGGTAHGFAPQLSQRASEGLWLVTYYTIGLSNLLLLWGGFVALVGGTPRFILFSVALLRFAIFAWLMTGERDFRFVIYDYAITQAALVVFAVALVRRPDGITTCWLMLAAVMAFAVGASLQRSSLVVGDLNHNDLFHVAQMAGLVALWGAGRRLQDAR